jgi:hypothetical protein
VSNAYARTKARDQAPKDGGEKSTSRKSNEEIPAKCPIRKSQVQERQKASTESCQGFVQTWRAVKSFSGSASGEQGKWGGTFGSSRLALKIRPFRHVPWVGLGHFGARTIVTAEEVGQCKNCPQILDLFR